MKAKKAEAAAAAHETALLAQPARLARTLVIDVWPSLPFRMEALLKAHRLLLSACEAEVNQSDAASAPPQSAPCERARGNAELMQALRCSLLALHSVCSRCDPRSLIDLACEGEGEGEGKGKAKGQAKGRGRRLSCARRPRRLPAGRLT